MAGAGSRFPQLSRGLKFTKAERKMMKKQTKALHTIKNRSHEVGEISDIPTPYLLVKNGGLMCGVKRQDLVNVLDKYGKLEDLIMLPGKSYCYALFGDAASSEEAMQNINGQKLLNETAIAGRTFYLAYLSKRPCTELCLSDKSCPPGMILIEDFISECLEHELLQCFSSNIEGVSSTSRETNVQAEQQLKHRYVKHYGYEFIYGSNNVDKDNPLPNGIPSECLPVMEKLLSLDCVKHEPDQLTINEYQPGQGIPPHVDTHSAFEDGIISLSLGAKVAMDFRHPDGRHVSVLLPRRSILIMTEECRYAWTHGITPRKYDVVNENDATTNKTNSVAEDEHSTLQHSKPSTNAVTLLPREVRLSLTFRKVRRTPCNCKYSANCDSQNYSSGRQSSEDKESSNNDDTSTRNCNSLPQSEEDAVILEKEHVHDVYESIAEHFSGTRHSPWPKIAAFLKEQHPGAMVADVGCGNGKYLGVNDELFMLGSDRSQNLAVICRERGHQVIACDILSLPYRSNSFDVCICIAVIHHLSTAARRLAAIKELTRIIRSGGRILISVWALEQNLPDTEMKKNRDHSGKFTQTGIFSTADQVDHLDVSESSEGNSCCTNSNVERTAGSAGNSLTNDGVLGTKQGLCSEVTKTVDHFGCQKDANLASHHNKNNRTIDASKICSESSYEKNAAKIDDASEMLPASSNTSRHQNGSIIGKETSSQEMHPIMEPQRISAASRKNSHELKVNTSRGVFEQQDLLIPWHYRGQKGCNNSSKNSTSASDKSKVDQDELELNTAGEEKVPKVFQRFYHVFQEKELADECRKLDNISIVRCYYDKGNWCVELQKVQEK